MAKTKCAITLALMVALGGCDTSNQTLGTILGAGAGAGLGKAIGGGTVGIIAGAAAGAWLGSELGKNFNGRDRAAMQNTTQTALSSSPAGVSSSWSNPESGNQGTVTPQQNFTNPDGQTCREYRQTITADGKTETGYGTACQQSDGSWRVTAN